MVLKLKVEEDKNFNATGYFIDTKSKEVIATGSNPINNYLSLNYKGDRYVFSTRPHLINEMDLSLKYPRSSKSKRNVGFYVLKDDEKFCITYQEAVTVGKRFIFKRGFQFEVFEYNGEPYMVYTAGPKGEADHYYCIYNNNGETIGIIQRHSYFKDGCKATIYFEDESLMLLMLLISARTLMWFFGSTEETRKDASAGGYYSMLKEEAEMLDKGFLRRFKINKC